VKIIANSFILILISFLIIGCTKKQEVEKIPITTNSEEARNEFLAGRDLFEKLRTQESLIHFENAIAKDSGFALAYYYHANANPTAKGFFEDVTNAVKNSKNVSEGEKLLITSLKAVSNGDTKLQKESLTKLAGLFPNDERVHFQLGAFYFGQQEYEKAVEHLKKSTEIATDYSNSFNMLGYSYRNMENYEEAEKAFLRYIELIPDDPNPYDSYAELLMKEGKYNESNEQYRKALNVKPDFINSFIGISTNYNFLRKYEEARKEAMNLYDIAKNDGEKRAALFTITVSYLDEGLYDNALTEMQKQYDLGKKINDYPSMSNDVNIMGNIYYEMGKFDEASKKYDESLNLILTSNLSEEAKQNSKNFDLYNKARIMLAKNDIDDAKEKLKEFKERVSESNNTFQLWLSHEIEGLIALKEKNYSKAETEFMMSNRQNPYTFYYLGLVYSSNNNMENADKYFKMASNFNSLNNMNQSFVRNKIAKMKL